MRVSDKSCIIPDIDFCRSENKFLNTRKALPTICID